MVGRILLIVLCVFALLLLTALLIPVHFHVTYENGAFRSGLRYGCFPISRGKENGESGEKTKEVNAAEDTAEKTQKTRLNKEQIIYTLETLPSVVLNALRRTGRRVRIEPLTFHVLVATPDPADTAVLFGKLHGAVAAVLPALHSVVRIREQDVRLFPDFSSDEMDFYADAEISIRPMDIFAVAVCAAAGVLKWYRGFKKRATKREEITDTTKKEATARADTAA